MLDLPPFKERILWAALALKALELGAAAVASYFLGQEADRKLLAGVAELLDKQKKEVLDGVSELLKVQATGDKLQACINAAQAIAKAWLGYELALQGRLLKDVPADERSILLEKLNNVDNKCIDLLPILENEDIAVKGFPYHMLMADIRLSTLKEQSAFAPGLLSTAKEAASDYRLYATGMKEKVGPSIIGAFGQDVEVTSERIIVEGEGPVLLPPDDPPFIEAAYYLGYFEGDTFIQVAVEIGRANLGGQLAMLLFTEAQIQDARTQLDRARANALQAFDAPVTATIAVYNQVANLTI